MARQPLQKRIRKFVRSPRNLLLSGILLVLGTTLLLSNKGLWRHLTLKHEVSARKVTLAKLEAQQSDVERQVALLRLEDAPTIERIARERYHMKRPGEIIYRAD